MLASNQFIIFDVIMVFNLVSLIIGLGIQSVDKCSNISTNEKCRRNHQPPPTKYMEYFHSCFMPILG